MNLEIGLLLLESFLLVATVILLLMSLKEGRGRDKLIMEVTRATKVLSRHEYFLTVIDTMMDAKEEILGSITGRMPSGEEAKRTKELAYNIEKLTAQGVKVRYLLPKFQDRLHVGLLYHKAGAEVLYSSCVLATDFRYMVVDSKIVVVGIPEGLDEKLATSKGYKIPSTGLALQLKESFERCGGIMSFQEFLRETLRQTGASPETLANEIKTEVSDIKRFIEQ
jgi:hypothetical protein